MIGHWQLAEFTGFGVLLTPSFAVALEMAAIQSDGDVPK
jgi:hypothetical protein